MSSIGRPEKYRIILNQLDPHRLYTPATIASKAMAMGLVGQESPKRSELAYRRVRIAMGRKSNNQQFPDEGDGMVTLPGQAPCPGWFGWRWQNSPELSPRTESFSGKGRGQ